MKSFYKQQIIYILTIFAVFVFCPRFAGEIVYNTLVKPHHNKLVQATMDYVDQYVIDTHMTTSDCNDEYSVLEEYTCIKDGGTLWVELPDNANNRSVIKVHYRYYNYNKFEKHIVKTKPNSESPANLYTKSLDPTDLRWEIKLLNVPSFTHTKIVSLINNSNHIRPIIEPYRLLPISDRDTRSAVYGTLRSSSVFHVYQDFAYHERYRQNEGSFFNEYLAGQLVAVIISMIIAIPWSKFVCAKLHSRKVLVFVVSIVAYSALAYISVTLQDLLIMLLFIVARVDPG